MFGGAQCLGHEGANAVPHDWAGRSSSFARSITRFVEAGAEAVLLALISHLPVIVLPYLFGDTELVGMATPERTVLTYPTAIGKDFRMPWDDPGIRSPTTVPGVL